MVRRMGNTRRIGGITFNKFASFKRKSEANITARKLRRGNPVTVVRVVLNKDKFFKKRFPFSVFTGRKKR